MKDRFTQGFMAGIMGWLPQMLFSITMYGIHLAKFRFMDYASAIVFYHRPPKDLFELIFAELVVVIFSGVLSIVFVFLLRLVNNVNVLFKGWLYGVACWFIIYSITVLYKMENIYKLVDPKTTFINFIAASIWGLGIAWSFLLLNRKFGIKE